MDLAFKVRDDIAEFASQSYNASSTDENITDEKVIDTETATIAIKPDNFNFITRIIKPVKAEKVVLKCMINNDDDQIII